MKYYTVILVTYEYKEMRIYGVSAFHSKDALEQAMFQDKTDYPEKPWVKEDNSYEIFLGHPISVGRD
jgi:hypothetical protein